MIYYILTTIVFYFIFLFGWQHKEIGNQHIQQNWMWNKFNHSSIKKDKRFPFSPRKTLNGYKTETEVYMFQTGKSIAIPRGLFVEISSLGRGFLTYKKIGKSISFLSGYGEKLWEKPFKSYPRISYGGELILHLSGDNNQVMISDASGNLIGAKKLDGRFISDYSFPVLSSGALILFAGGEVFRIDDKGHKVFAKTYPIKNKLLFFKSSCISPHGNFSAIHFLNGETDSFLILDKAGKEILKYLVAGIYPHKVFMAISDTGHLLINLPDKVLLLNKKGKELLNLTKPKKQGVYQLAFFSGIFFAFSNQNKLFFTDINGNIIGQKSIVEYPYRMIPSGLADVVLLESTSSIISFQFIKP